MNDQPPDPVNIGTGQQRLRLMIGIVSVVVGVASAFLLLAYDVNAYWRLVLFLPFWSGALGILQYRDGI